MGQPAEKLLKDKSKKVFAGHSFKLVKFISEQYDTIKEQNFHTEFTMFTFSQMFIYVPNIDGFDNDIPLAERADEFPHRQI